VAGQELDGYSQLTNPAATVRAAEKPGIITILK
jgi:hypothetical protein